MKTDQNPYGFHTRPEVVKVVPPAKRLLDVGCNTGGFAFGLRSVNARVGEIWGIEPNEAAAELAAEHVDRLLVGSYPDALPEGATFDLIAFNDVLEHMTDPWEVLRRTHDFLTPQGLIVVSLPNIRFWPVLMDLVFRGEWVYTDAGTLDRTHLRFFTKTSAQRMLEDSGYSVISVSPGFTLDTTRRNLPRRLLPKDLRTLQYVFLARSSRT
jgi:2-polyprenyl-3-methyl-5-hydroxy-6-metoxy-1,4-benzoquinol methylase